jgi:tRNA threonylcarbamoyladenosine biosynthesis protein TsaE
VTCTLATRSPEETRAFAERLGALLQPGDVLVLGGEMGAGKTAFAKGIAIALGIEESVASPTFTIMREYSARIPLVHVDVYRLDHVQELHDLGLDDVLGEEAVTLIEWGDKVGAALPGDRLDIHIEFGDGDDDRTFRIDCSGRTWVARRDAIAALADDCAPGGEAAAGGGA